MKHLSTLAALALVCACGPAAADRANEGIERLAFLEGEWASEYEERWTEERWSGARAGMMIGTGRSGEGKALESFEYLRIVTEEDGTIVYLAAPGGGEPTRFELAETGENSAIFLNADHDFPQRISYARSEETMAVEIAMADGSDAIGWELRLEE